MLDILKVKYIVVYTGTYDLSLGFFKGSMNLFFFIISEIVTTLKVISRNVKSICSARSYACEH